MKLFNLILAGVIAVSLCLAQPPKKMTVTRPTCNASTLGMKWPSQNPTHACMNRGALFHWVLLSSQEYKGAQGGSASQGTHDAGTRPTCNAQNVGMKWPTVNPTYACQKIGTNSFSWGVIGRSQKLSEHKTTTQPDTR
jgi:hypothetical protein